MTRTFSVPLPYYKQGDDFAAALDASGGDVLAALEQHATCLVEAAEQLRALAARIAGQPVELSGDTHLIAGEGPEDLVVALATDRLVQLDEFDDEDELEDEGFDGEE
jgi:hypothetical protein